MKVFVAVATVALSALGACGNGEELKTAQAKIDSLTKENAGLKSAVTELNNSVGKITAERDDFKAQVEKAAIAAATPPPPPAGKAGAAAKPAAKPAAKKHK